MSRDLSQRIVLEAVCLQKQAEHQCAQQSLAQLHIHSSCCIETHPEIRTFQAYDMHKNLEGKTILSLEHGHMEMEFMDRREKMAFAHCTQEEWSDVSSKLLETATSLCIKRHGVRYCSLACGGFIEDAEEYLGILLQVYNTSSFIDKPVSRKRKA